MFGLSLDEDIEPLTITFLVYRTLDSAGSLDLLVNSRFMDAPRNRKSRHCTKERPPIVLLELIQRQWTTLDIVITLSARQALQLQSILELRFADILPEHFDENDAVRVRDLNPFDDSSRAVAYAGNRSSAGQFGRLRCRLRSWSVR